MKVIKDLECIIMFCEEPTYLYCLESVKAQTFQPKRIVRIENVTPINESINARHEAMELAYSVKVDADMFLYPECFEKLYRQFEAIDMDKLNKYYAVTGMLLDPFIGKMGAIHMEKTDLVRRVIVEDMIGCDRILREKMKKRGYHIFELPSIVGEHWCDYSAEAIFKRHIRVGQKHFYYRDKHHEDWVRNIGKLWVENKNDSAFLALLGYCFGLLTPDDTEKGLRFMEEEWAAVEELIRDGVLPKPKQLWSLRDKSTTQS